MFGLNLHTYETVIDVIREQKRYRRHISAHTGTSAVTGLYLEVH